MKAAGWNVLVQYHVVSASRCNSQVTCFHVFIPFICCLPYISSSFSFVRLSMSLTPLSSSVFLPSSSHFFRLFLLPFFVPFLVSPSLSACFSFFQPVFSLFPFCFALFIAVFLSAFIPFHYLFVFISVSYSAHSRRTVESHLSRKFSLLGEFYDTQQIM